MPETIIDLKNQEEAEARAMRLIDQVIEKRLDHQQQDFERRLEELAKPDTDRALPVTNEEDAPEERVASDAMVRPAGQIEVRGADAPLYERLRRSDPVMGEWRTPENDYLVQQWAIAMSQKDMARACRVHDRVCEIYGRQWLVGVVGDASAGATYTGTAGPAVPLPLLNMIMINRDRMAKVPMLSTTINMTTNSHRIPQMDQVTAAMAAENATAAEVQPTLTEKLAVAHKMQARMEVSDEVLKDSAFNLAGMLGTRTGQAFGQLEDEQACESDGAAPNISEPIRVGLTLTNIAGALTYADVVALYFGVGQPYRANGVWYGNGAGLSALTALTDNGGYPIFSNQSNIPGAITDDSADGVMFRRPVYEVPLIDSVATGGTGALMFMGADVYGWGRRQGMEARVSDAPGWATDTWSYKFTQRVEGLLLDPGGAGNASRAGAENFS